MAPGPETKELVSYLPDADWLPDWMRVEELVEMFRDFYGTPSQAKAYIGFDADKANEMLARLNIAPNARLKTLSKGNKEKVQLVLAMSRNARLYLLDEPSAAWTCGPGLHPEHHHFQLQQGRDRCHFYPPHRGH